MNYIKFQTNLFFLFFFLALTTKAFVAKSFSAGVGYQSQNVIGKITQSATGAKSVLGTAVYPFLLEYEMPVTNTLFFAPRLTYTFLNRSATGSSGKVTEWHLMLPVGMNISNSTWDWTAGIGIYDSKISGSGGIVTLSCRQST